MFLRILLIFAWALLAVGGSWHWWCKVRERCGPATVVEEQVVEEPRSVVPASPSISPFVVNYEGLPFLSFADNLRFGKSAPLGRIPGVVGTALDSLAAYLMNQPGQKPGNYRPVSSYPGSKRYRIFQFGSGTGRFYPTRTCTQGHRCFTIYQKL